MGAGKPHPRAHTEASEQPEWGTQGRGSSSLVLLVRLFLVHHLHFMKGRKKRGKALSARVLLLGECQNSRHMVTCFR